MRADDPRHGTRAGYYAHRKDGETACDDCRQAAAVAEQRRQLSILQGAPSPMVDATGTRRRIQALRAMGYTQDALACEMGVSHNRIYELTTTVITVRESTAAKIADLYERICMTIPPTSTRHQREGVSKAKKVAARRGWAPPLAWDDIDRDAQHHLQGRGRPIPDATSVDEAVVERICAGDAGPARSATVAERAAVCAQWRRSGRFLSDLEHLTGWNADRYTDKTAAA